MQRVREKNSISMQYFGKASLPTSFQHLACADKPGVLVERTSIDGMDGQGIPRIVLEDDECAATYKHSVDFR